MTEIRLTPVVLAAAALLLAGCTKEGWREGFESACEGIPNCGMTCPSGAPAPADGRPCPETFDHFREWPTKTPSS